MSGGPGNETEGYLVTAVKNAAVDILRKAVGGSSAGGLGSAAPGAGTDYRYLVSLIRRCRRSYRQCWS